MSVNWGRGMFGVFDIFWMVSVLSSFGEISKAYIIII